MYDLFTRLKTPRRRVIAQRQLEILKLLLGADWMNLEEIVKKTTHSYSALDLPRRALIRDLNDLIHLGAVKFERLPDNGYQLAVRLQWPTEITEMAFYNQLKALPKAKAHSFLQ
jgi:predicted transcriptional regulator